MIPLLEQHRDGIAAICRKHGVQKLEIFGSAATDEYDPEKSDIDFFYEFDADTSQLADRFFGLGEDLQALLGHPVDLVSSQDVSNPFFLQVANQHRILLYAA